jgi:hypothetical protein
MGKTQIKVHLEQECSYTCECIWPNELCTSKTKWWGSQSIVFPFQEGDIEWKRDDWTLEQNLIRQMLLNAIKYSDSRIILFGSMLYPPCVLGWQHQPYRSSEQTHLFGSVWQLCPSMSLLGSVFTLWHRWREPCSWPVHSGTVIGLEALIIFELVLQFPFSFLERYVHTHLNSSRILS